ncbi:DUF1933 domain-containing protein [Rouxiella sp. S1S-2]|uniref:asparagine synthase family protein n=1 Tax=Rouxiella sp. S1S-2 TaxID=2653856 RepID=UPI001264430B|nr:asparagine synthetase B family protein [Rouxiella sp. S1S-2]KAB7894857.1 DUF1933 domain-containing protein [Rouxiella sp. S1S-2]
MNTEFCYVRSCPDKKFHPLTRECKSVELLTGVIFLRGDFCTTNFESDVFKAYLIGDIYNIEILKSTLGKLEGNIWSANDAEVLCLLRERLGDEALSLAEGDFCLIIEYKQGEIEVLTDSKGLNLVSIVMAEQTWITNSLKMVGIVEGEKAFHFFEEGEFINQSTKNDTFIPIRNATRFKPGTINKLSYYDKKHPFLESKLINSLQSRKLLTLNKNILYELLDTDMKCSISRLTNNNTSIGIPLSGGLDSSLVTALACQYFKSVKTWSIGTELGDEFRFSKIVSDTLGTQHEVKILSDEDILSGVLKAIYHNEIFDGLSSEIQSGLFNVYGLAQGKVNTLLTGYGSDLLFGGILNPQKNYDDPNEILSEQVYRTRWTGEFSTQGARSYDLNVRHIFWSNTLISLCRNLDPQFKIRDNEVKNILREYTESLNLLPKEIVWRKKIGIHEGSSINKCFAKIIATTENNYIEKTKFTYSIYKKFLTGKLKLLDASTMSAQNLKKGE